MCAGEVRGRGVAECTSTLHTLIPGTGRGVGFNAWYQWRSHDGGIKL